MPHRLWHAFPLDPRGDSTAAALEQESSSVTAAPVATETIPPASNEVFGRGPLAWLVFVFTLAATGVVWTLRAASHPRSDVLGFRAPAVAGNWGGLRRTARRLRRAAKTDAGTTILVGAAAVLLGVLIVQVTS
jgi:hypothetical protein